MKIKKGDSVIVRSGKDKGKIGTVIAASPKDNTVVVEGVNIAKRHTKPKRAGETGEIKDVPQPLHVSIVGIVGPNGAAVRVGYDVKADGTKVRVARGKGKGATL